MTKPTELEDATAPRAAMCGDMAVSYLSEVWEIVVRPPRMNYTLDQLESEPPASRFPAGSHPIRTDFEVVNLRNQRLCCTLFEPPPMEDSRERACVVFCHDSRGCRLSGFHLAPLLLPLNIGLLCFDFAGAGQSDGEQLSFGFYEQDDIACVAKHLRRDHGYARLALWGETMGAAAALLYASRDPTLACLVLDSAFTDLWTLLGDVCKEGKGLPAWLVGPYLHMVRVVLQRKADFDLCEVTPEAHAARCFSPALFLHGEANTFVPPSHSARLQRSYGGEVKLLRMPGVTQSCPRPEEFLARAAAFLVRALRWERHLPVAITQEVLAALARGQVLDSSLHPSQGPPLTRGVLGLLSSPSVRSQCLGLVRAACECSSTYRGARYLPAVLPGSQTVSPYRTAGVPTELTGHVSFLAEGTELALCWVREGAVGDDRTPVAFAVISPLAVSLTRVTVCKGREASLSGSFLGGTTKAPLHCEPAETLCFSSAELGLHRPHPLRLRVSRQEASLTVGCVVLTACLQGKGPLHLWCFHWRQPGHGHVHPQRPEAEMSPLGAWLELGGALELPATTKAPLQRQALLDCKLELPRACALPGERLQQRQLAVKVTTTEVETQTTLPFPCAFQSGGKLQLSSTLSTTQASSTVEAVLQVPEELPVPPITMSRAQDARDLFPQGSLSVREERRHVVTPEGVDPSKIGGSLSQDPPRPLVPAQCQPIENGPAIGGAAGGQEKPPSAESASLPVKGAAPTKGSPPAKGAGKGKGKGKGKPGPGPKEAGKGQGQPARQPRQPVVVPRVPLKRLFWTPISLDASQDGNCSSVWDRVHDLGADFDKDELEALFAKGQPEASGGGSSRGQSPAREQRPGPRRLLEEQRRRQVWCMLALLPDWDTTLQAIASLDDAVLPPDKVDVLLTNLPAPAEEAALRAARDEAQEQVATPRPGEAASEEWDSPEACLLRLLDLPGYALRVRAWGFLNSFGAAAEHLRAAEVDCRAAGSLLRDSERIARLLAVILSIGNYLNGGTPRGRADGFELDSLVKLGELKTCKRGTLVDFIVEQVNRDHPGMLTEILQPDQECERVHRARRHKMTDLQEELNSLVGQAESFSSQMQTRISEGDRQLEQPSLRLQAQLASLKEMQGRYRDWGTLYAGLCAWFRMGAHRDKGVPATDDFFGIWDSFFSGLRTAQEAWEKRLQQEQLQQRCRPQRASSAPARGGRRPEQDEARQESDLEQQDEKARPPRQVPRRSSVCSLAPLPPTPRRRRPSQAVSEAEDGSPCPLPAASNDTGRGRDP